MFGKQLLAESTRLIVFVDSDTFDRSNDPEKNCKKFLQFANNNQLKYLRTFANTENDELSKIPQIRIAIADEINSYCSIFDAGENSEKAVFMPSNFINTLIEKVFDDYEHDIKNLNRISPVRTHKYFESKDNTSIYITNNRELLKYRHFLLSKIDGFLLFILSPEEAVLFLDLFFKKQELFYISSNSQTSMFTWYHLSTYEKIPNIFDFHDKISCGLFNRMKFALQALDKIGIQNFSVVNLNNVFSTTYHFTFLISLITGIFDNLAIKTDCILNFNLKPEAITLSKVGKREFRDQLRNCYPELFEHVRRYDNFISTIYEFREMAIHREGFDSVTFHNNGHDVEFVTCFVKLPDNRDKAIQLIKQLETNNNGYYPFSDSVVR